jgi:hypothetical protein
MNFGSFLKSKINKLLLALLALGITIAVWPFLFEAEQCPLSYTQQQVDASGCIDGANIGAGLMFFLGIFIVIVVSCILTVSLLSRRFRELKPRRKVWFIIGSFAVAYMLLNVLLSLVTIFAG